MDPSSSLAPYCSSYKWKRDDDDDEPFDWCKRPKHDVFLSYCNEEIGKSFVSHLKGSLDRNGFDISDNTTLRPGQYESFEVLKAIQESWMYVVVFSSKYPFSVNCLDELVLIMDSVSKFKKRKVFPIFYKVDPSHVRSQQDASFLEAFRGHRDNIEDGERVEKWRRALQDVGNRAGEHFHTWENEEEFVRKIVKSLGKVKLPLELFDTEHSVGIEPRAKHLISELNLDDPRPSITAVLGMSGSGKTTLVKAVFDTIVTDFDASCFIENMRYYKHNGPNWKVVLQHDVISRFTGDDYRIHNVVAANVRNFVSSRKVLLVLDDVDKYEQLEALGVQNHHASFGWGSRILVTTTNTQSLSGLHKKYTSYEISLLDKRESSEVFIGHTYGKDDPVDEKFVEEIVWRAGGLPLVLEVWGRYFKSHERKQWPRLLKKLRRIPHEDVQEKLRVSYDSLSPRAKSLFLDVTCFFDGMKKNLVIKVLEDEENAFFPDIEIQHLIDKGLVKVDTYGDLRMHEVIMEMGKEVVRQENEDDRGQRSRLMYWKDVVRVLRDCSGTDAVRSIYLDLNDDLDEDVIVVQIEAFRKMDVIVVQIEAFRKMSNLRFIKLVDNYFEHKLQCSFSNGEINYRLCFKHLKYLEWLGFPFKCMDNIEMGNVVVIRLLDSKLKTLWEGALKSLKKLRILDVSRSQYLIRTGSFIGLENLEELYLFECSELEELDTSIGCLQKLCVLDLRWCKQLKRVPWEMIGKLTSLVTLNLNYGPNVLNISHQLGNLKSLKQLYLGRNNFPSLPADSICQLHQLSEIRLSGCDNLKSIPNLPPNIQEVDARDCRSLESLPSNMSELQYLTRLYLDDCIKLGSQGFVKVTGLRNLQRLCMRNCNVSQVCSEIGNMVSLVKLDLSGNTFTSLPDNVSNLSQLMFLEINDCYKLKLLPLLPSQLRIIEANGCESLDVMPYDSRKLGYMFRSQWCRHLQLVNSQQHDPSALYTHLIINLSLWKKEEDVAIPEWCSYSSIGGEDLSLVAPPHITTTKICGVIIYYNTVSVSVIGIIMINKTKGTSHEFRIQSTGYVVMELYPLNDGAIVVEAGDKLIVQYYQICAKVSCFGLRLIYEDDVVDDSTLLFSNSSSINQEVCILSRKEWLYYKFFPGASP